MSADIDALLAALADAAVATDDAQRALSDAKERHDAALVRCRAAGIPFRRLAYTRLVAVHGRAELAERRREANRLRQRWVRVTARNGNQRGKAVAVRARDVAWDRGGHSMPQDPKAPDLVRKTVIEEYAPAYEQDTFGIPESPPSSMPSPVPPGIDIEHDEESD